MVNMSKQIHKVMRSSGEYDLGADHKFFVVQDSATMARLFGHKDEFFWVTNRSDLTPDQLSVQYGRGEIIIRIFRKDETVITYTKNINVKYGKYN